MQLRVPVSAGELLDKISILEIKSERIDDAGKLVNIRRELDLLHEVWTEVAPDGDPQVDRLREELKEVNEELWEIEDAIREQEFAGTFGPTFVELARSVYLTNDRRADLKKRLNLRLGSELVEEKSYSDYRPAGD